MDMNYLINQINSYAKTENRSAQAIEYYVIGIIGAAKTKVSEENIHKLCARAEALCNIHKPLNKLERSERYARIINPGLKT